MKIIDSRVRLRTKQLLKPWTTDLRPYFKEYIRIYKMKSRLTEMPVQDLLDHAAQLGVEKMVICGNDQEDNDYILELADKYKELIPIASISMENGIRSALLETERCFNQGFAAISIAPYRIKLNVNDRLLYPIYGHCELIRKPVIVHGAIHFLRRAYMWHGQPQFIDEIAVDFPELKLIVSHGGNGFGPPILAVAQRHPNVYLEFSALNPQYMAPEFLYATNTYLKKRCLFGTDYPLMEFDVSIKRWKKVLRENVTGLFFYQNVLDALYKEPVKF